MKPFKILTERQISEGRYPILEADLETPEGKRVTWSIIAGKDIVVVFPLDAEHNVYIKREWRLNRKDFVWEVPSGVVEEENPTTEQIEAAAQRELQEEVGMKTGTLKKLLTLYPSNHRRAHLHLFLATDLTEGKLEGDEHEFVEVKKLPFQEALELVMKSQEPTAQNALIFLMAKDLLAEKKLSPMVS